MEQTLDYYRIKTEWTAEAEDGQLVKKKTEELVLAPSYGEAEKIAYAIAEDQNRFRFSCSRPEIIRTKISDILYTESLKHDSSTIRDLTYNYFAESEDTGVGLYAVKVMFIVVDEKTAKEKRSTETIYVPAASNLDAADFIEQWYQESGENFVIRDTKFDKAEAILWPADTLSKKMDAYK